MTAWGFVWRASLIAFCVAMLLAPLFKTLSTERFPSVAFIISWTFVWAMLLVGAILLAVFTSYDTTFRG